MSNILNIKLKSVKLTLICLIAPLFIFAQNLTGLWTGTFSNDSNSIRKDQSYEIALTEYRGKVYGYSRAEFIVNDTLYYIVKRVKGKIDGDVCEVKDDEILAYNFPGKLDKGIKVSSFFYRNKIDSNWYLGGNWKTNTTKKYYSLTGKVQLKEEKDLTASKLFPHLQELNLLNDVAFYKEKTKQPDPVVMKKIEPEKKEPIQDNAVASVQEIETKPIQKNTTPIPTQNNNSAKITDTRKVSALNDAPLTEKNIPKQVKNEVTAKPNNPVSTEFAIQNNPPAPVKENLEARTESSITKSITNTQQPKKTEISNPVKNNVVKSPAKNETVKVDSKVPEKQIINQPDKKLQAPTVQVPAPTTTQVQPVTASVIVTKSEVKPAPTKETLELTELMAGRKSEFSQMVNFKSDSLELALYDNGEIDGDTVSIFLNGEMIMARQGLKATAIKKTIYLVPGKDDEFTLVLFADNLGKYPPNTGLLVVHDGDDVYNVRFSADLQKNAGVVFKRKK